MAEEKVCKVCLSKPSNKSISSVIYTLKIPNVFILPEYSDTFEAAPCPSFEFANGTFHFRCSFLKPIDDSRGFDIYMVRLKSEIPEEKVFYNITLLDSDGKVYDEYCYTSLFKVAEEERNIFSAYYHVSFYEKLNTLTLIIQLFHDKSTHVDSSQELLGKDKDSDVLSQDFKKLFLNGKNHDLTLRVADKEFRVHQDILMARSQVFQAMLTHDMTEKNKSVIDVPDCDPQAMEQFLFYVYSGKVETLNQENALGLYYAADKYNMTLLKEQCTEYIKKSLTPSIICGVIQLALNHSDSDLLECATEYFLDHTREIFPTLEWMSFMKTSSIAANELLIKASEKWNSAKC